jgi:HK97 gp10 family phage protein
MTGHVEFNWDAAAVIDEVHARIAKNMLELADKVVERAAYLAPKKTTYLAGSIGYDWNYAELTIVFTVGAPYGIFQEYGTRNMPPHPYLRPAINAFGPIYGFNTEMAFTNTPEYNQPVLAVGSRFATPPTLSSRQKSRVRENELYSKKYYQHPTGNVRRTRMHARRRQF